MRRIKFQILQTPFIRLEVSYSTVKQHKAKEGLEFCLSCESNYTSFLRKLKNNLGYPHNHKLGNLTATAAF